MNAPHTARVTVFESMFRNRDQLDGMNANLYETGCEYLALREEASAGFANVADYSATAMCTKQWQPAEAGGYKESRLRKAELVGKSLWGLVKTGEIPQADLELLECVIADALHSPASLRKRDLPSFSPTQEQEQRLVYVLGFIADIMFAVNDHADLRRWRGGND